MNVNRLRVYIVAAILAVVLLGSVWKVNKDTALARSIPLDIRDSIWEGYQGDVTIAWQAYHIGPDASFAVIKRAFGRGCPEYDVYRITGTGSNRKMETWTIFWEGGTLEADCGYDVLDESSLLNPKPYRQNAVGTAFDRKIVKVVLFTADGRSTEAELFDGFWWVSSNLDPNTYRADRWVKAVAFDSQATVLYQFNPRYGYEPK